MKNQEKSRRSLEEKREQVRQKIQELSEIVEKTPEIKETLIKEIQKLSFLDIDDLLPRKPFKDLTDKEIETIEGITNHELLFSRRLQVRADLLEDSEENATRLFAICQAIEQILKEQKRATENRKDTTERNEIPGASEIKDINEIFEKALSKRGPVFDIIEAAIKRVSSPSITSVKAKKIDMPIDKLNNTIWNGFQLTESGQYSLLLDTSKGSRGTAPLIAYSVDFSELLENVKLSKTLSAMDKRVYEAVGALFNAGNKVTTVSQIYKAMGNTGNASGDQLKKINDSITKMRSIVIYVDNSAEVKKYPNYPLFTYDGHLLPFERISAYVNGSFTDAAIQLFREPPLLTFARDRKQITTIDIKLLESPVNKTENSIKIEDYLIRRISQAKAGHGQKKILFETLFNNCEITEKKAKQRARKTIVSYLEHYKKCDWITDYSTDANSIYFDF